MLQIHSDTNLNYKFKWLVVKSYMNSTSNSDIIIIEVIRQELTTAEVIKHIFIDEVIKHIRNSSMVPVG
jgi:hypothetical protein